MLTTTLSPLEPGLPPPPRLRGLLPWARRHLFANRLNLLITLGLTAALLVCVPRLLEWALLQAVFHADAAACREASGACWGVVAEKYRQILFGRYPYAEQWRALLATVILIGALVATCRCRLAWRRLLGGWGLSLLLVFTLLAGGWGGLPAVPSNLWGGLPLTLLLSIGTVIGACPLALLLALGRRSKLPALHTLCTLFIEVLRSVPLVSVLLLAAFLVPLFLPRGASIDVLFRVWLGLMLFSSAYLAEVLRGGLQSIPPGQTEAAAALGLSYRQIQLHIVLPQAIRATLPALMNNFISIIKETSLVTVVSLYELSGAMTLALSGDPEWREFYLECYIFVAALYWIGCFSLSRYSHGLAQRLRTDRR